MTALAAILLALATPAPADEPSYRDRPLSGWLAMLRDDPLPRKRRAAVVALGELAPHSAEVRASALAAVSRALRTDAKPEVREEAARVIAAQKPDDSAFLVTDLVNALREEQIPAVRRLVATALGRFGAAASPAVGVLTKALADADAGVRAAGAESLGRVGKDAGTAAPELVKLLADPDAAARLAAIGALGKVEPADRPAAGEALARLQPGDSAEVRLEVLAALGRLGATSPAIEAFVRAALDDARPPVRVAALQSVAAGRTGGAALAPRVLELAKADADGEVRTGAVRAFPALGLPPGEVALKLADLLKSDRLAGVRVAAVEELGKLGADAKPQLGELRRARSDADPKVREAASAAIRRIEAGPEPVQKP